MSNRLITTLWRNVTSRKLPSEKPALRLLASILRNVYSDATEMDAHKVVGIVLSALPREILCNEILDSAPSVANRFPGFYRRILLVEFMIRPSMDVRESRFLDYLLETLEVERKAGMWHKLMKRVRSSGVPTLDSEGLFAAVNLVCCNDTSDCVNYLGNTLVSFPARICHVSSNTAAALDSRKTHYAGNMVVTLEPTLPKERVSKSKVSHIVYEMKGKVEDGQIECNVHILYTDVFLYPRVYISSIDQACKMPGAKFESSKDSEHE